MSKRAYRQTESTWSKERRAAQAERIRVLNCGNAEFNAKRKAGLSCSKKARQQRARLGKQRRGTQLAPEQHQFLIEHMRRITRDPIIIAKVTAARRYGPIPKGYRKRYRTLRDLIGPQAAMGIVKREAAMAPVNA